MSQLEVKSIKSKEAASSFQLLTFNMSDRRERA